MLGQHCSTQRKVPRGANDAADPARPPRFIQPGDPLRGTLTIGYGHTRTARPGQRITQVEAERLLREDLAPVEAAIARSITVPLTDGQHGAPEEVADVVLFLAPHARVGWPGRPSSWMAGRP